MHVSKCHGVPTLFISQKENYTEQFFTYFFNQNCNKILKSDCFKDAQFLTNWSASS